MAHRTDEIDIIDHHPGTLQKAEQAARNAHLDGINAEQAQAASGTVNLLHRYGKEGKDNIVLIPAPTADPQDPLNLPLWRRVALLVMLQIFASFGQSAVSAFATLIPFLEDEYVLQEGKNDQDLLNLSVMPTLTQGLSNLALGPLIIAFGRRPVYLFANFLMILSCILAANNTNYEQHLAYRLMMGASVGIGQTLVPLMVKESFFLHQRGTWLAYSGTINSIFGLVWGMFVPNVVGQVGWRNLYYIDAGILSFFFLFGIFLMPETKFERSLEAFNGLGYGKQSSAQQGHSSPDLDDDKEKAVDEQFDRHTGGLIQITALTRPDIDNVNFRPRTWLSDLRPVQRSFDLPLALSTFKNCFQLLFFPNVLILCAVNFWFLTMTIVHSATYPRVLIGPPNRWSRDSVGYIQGGAVLDIILTPILLGYLSDYLTKFFAKRRHGVAEPEVRFLTFLFPMCLGWISMILHGYMQKYPTRVHWSAQLFIFGFLNHAFSATAIGTQTVLLDSYPTRAASTLIIINTFRGAMAFAFMGSFGKTIADLGGPFPAWSKFGAIGAGLTVAVLILFFVGKKIRLLTLRFVVDTDKDGQAKNRDS